MTGQRGRERGRERGPTPRSRAGIAGTVYPRGKKWAYAVTLAPDPLTGERRRDARSGFDTEKAAWDALIEANNQLRSNTYVKNSTTTVGQFGEPPRFRIPDPIRSGPERRVIYARTA